MMLVFHLPSGSTHFLDSPVPEILALLGTRGMTADELCEALCRQFGIPSDAEAAAVVAARLDELVASGLVQVG